MLLGHEGRALMNGTCALVKETSERPFPLPPCEDTAKIAVYKPGNGSLPDNPSPRALTLTLSSLQNCKQKTPVVYMPLNPWYSAQAAQMD